MKKSNNSIGNGICFVLISITLIIFFQSCEKDSQSAQPEENNKPVLKWRIPDDGSGGQPWGIAIDNNSYVYVSLLDGCEITKFDSSGTLVTRWGTSGSGDGELYWPKYLSVDSSNNVYVADNMNNRMEKFDASGNYLGQWGGIGAADFDGACGVAVDTKNKWVYVTGQIKIQKFDLSGNLIMQWGSFGTGNGEFEFYDPNFEVQGSEGDVAVDKDGYLYVVDNMNCRVQKFTPAGDYVLQWGSKGNEKGKFLYPSGIAIDNQSGMIYISDNSTPYGGSDNVARIEKFDLSGNFQNQWILTDEYGNQSVGGLAVDKSGNVYAVEGESISKYNL